MTLEFYLDYLCPKCYLQHKVLEEMIETEQIVPGNIIYRSYEMVNHDQFDQSLSFIDFIARYKHLPQDEVIAFLREQNINIHLFPIHNVHKMAHLAKKEKKSYDYSKAVFEAIYEKNLDLSNNELLKTLALNVGLNAEKIDLVLNTDLFSNAVISNKENGQLKGVLDLPFIRVNRHIKLCGLVDEFDIVAAANQDHLDHHEYCVGEHCQRHHKVS